MVKLISSWSFWYHSSKVRKWDKDSYTFLYKTQIAEEFWGVFKLLTMKHYESGIIFIMREDIFPDWSSPENRNGGFISIKIETKSRNYKLNNITKIWFERLISESITIDKNLITHGISLSPKSGHCILKLWLKDKINNSNSILQPDLPLVKTNKFTAFTHKS
tara:strand:- start:2768 stop:3253 length:486 start_codon:yes stop_codon:yes gene_type:complete